jgi:choline dehydrogenase
VDDQTERSPLTEIFIAACQDTGIPFNPDLNGAEIEGCGYFPATLKNNERCSTATAYLEPASSRENLTIESGATVTRIVLKGNRAVGADYFQRGQSHHALADSEIILCAGAIGSPQMLQLSGIGPAALLKSAGVDVLHDLPGVGENLQDHLHYRSRWEITEPVTFFGRNSEELKDVQRRYDNNRSGPLTTNHFESGAFLNTRSDLDAPDIELLMIPFFISIHATELRPPDRQGFTISGFPTRPQSRGRVAIMSDDPLDRPVIDPGYLKEPADLRLMVEIVKRSRDIVASAKFDGVRGCEISPGTKAQSDADIVEDIRAISSTSFHPVGSCKMGTDEMAVADPQLRVRGVAGLRVADASIMPEMNTGHPNAPTIMIAERAADFLFSDA